MKSLAVEQLIKDYTRVTQTSRTMITLVFSDCSHISCSGVMNINISDHLPIYLIKKKEREKIYEKKEIWGRSYRNYDSSRFTALLDTVDWSEFDDEETPDRLWEIMFSNITKALDAICPIMKLMIPSKKRNNDILQLMRERDSYYARARSLNKADDWNIAKPLHNRVQMAIKAHKSSIIKEDLERYKNNPQKFSEMIYEILIMKYYPKMRKHK